MTTVTPSVTTAPVDYSAHNLAQLARVIRKAWPSPYFGAVPYLDAMSTMDSVADKFGDDSGASIVLYFLSNATAWRGDTSRAVKAELKRRLK